MFFYFKLDHFYLKQKWMRENGYIRSIVVRFNEGPAAAGNEAYHVSALVQHQFVGRNKEFKAFMEPVGKA